MCQCALSALFFCALPTQYYKIIYTLLKEKSNPPAAYGRVTHVESVVRRVVPSCTTSRRPHLSAPFTATRTSGSRSGPMRAVWLWVRAVSWVRYNTPGEPQRAAPRSPCARALHAARQAVPWAAAGSIACSRVQSRRAHLRLAGPEARLTCRGVACRGVACRGAAWRGAAWAAAGQRVRRVRRRRAA